MKNDIVNTYMIDEMEEQKAVNFKTFLKDKWDLWIGKIKKIITIVLSNTVLFFFLLVMTMIVIIFVVNEYKTYSI
jgi:lipopolysaccharide/colanic/teichoic acid biosynthesis glycosyltransferase